MDEQAARALAAAMETARGYDLSERAYQLLFGQLIALETDFGAEAAPQVDAILEIATARERLLFENPLLGIRQSGAHIQQLAACLVLTDSEPTPAGGQTPRPDAPEWRPAAPKTRELLQALRSWGIFADDLFVVSGSVRRTMVRRRPYILIGIPRLQKQIAISDDLGEAVLVAPATLPLDVWLSNSKTQLEQGHGVERLRYDVDGRWLSALRPLLLGADATLDPARFPKQALPPVTARPLLTAGIVVHWLKAFHLREGRYPYVEDRQVWDRDEAGEWFTVADVSWKAIAGALSRGRVLDAGSAKNLGQFKAEHGLIDRPLTDAMIIRWIELFQEKEGRPPNQRDITVWDRRDGNWIALADESWMALSTALRKGSRGLPARGITLPQFRDQTLGKAQELTPEVVANWLRQHAERTGRFPAHHDEVWAKDGDGAWTSVPYESWAPIFRCIRYGGRGLQAFGSVDAFVRQYVDTGEKEPWPALPSLRAASRRSVRPPHTEERIVQWMKLHHERTGAYPTRDSGEVMVRDNDGAWVPVAAENWRAINECVRIGTRGLTSLRGQSLSSLRDKHFPPDQAERPKSARARKLEP